MSDPASRDATMQIVMQAQKSTMEALTRTQASDWVQLDLSMGQLKALMTLAREPNVPVSAVAEKMNIGKPAASILIDRLVQLGYVERAEDAEDRRRTLVRLSSSGMELATNLRYDHSDLFARCLQRMTTDDLKALARGLQALTAAIAQEREEHGREEATVASHHEGFAAKAVLSPPGE